LAARIPASITELALRLVLALAAPASFAAHPLQTEDTSTQGAGNLEIRNDLSRVRFDTTTVSTYQPQVSLGLAPTLDAIVQPAFEWQRSPQERDSGWGDTRVDAKWRFWGGDPLSLALRAGLELATNERGFGLTHGKTSEHGVLALTWDRSPTTVHANLGVRFVPRAAASPARRAMTSVSAAVMQRVDEHLVLTLDSSFGQSPNPHRGAWPGTVLAGVIWAARPGLDLDLGWRRSIDDQPVTRAWLAELTYRFKS
jgi:hypothetical protein